MRHRLRSNLDGLDHRLAGQRGDLLHALRRFRAMGLIHVRSHDIVYFLNCRIIGIDDEGDDFCPAARVGGKLLCQRKRDMARASGIKHEADKVGAGVDCRVDRFQGGEPANLDINHGAGLPGSFVPRRRDRQRR